MSFKKIVLDIKNLRVQGAKAVALAGLRAMDLAIKQSKAKTKSQFVSEVRKARLVLFKSRPTEPALRNAVNSVLSDIESNNLLELKKLLRLKIHKAENHFILASKSIAEIGSKLIQKNFIVYTHCHSSAVMGILKNAKSSGTNFKVVNTETRPWFQGRLTAKELSKSKIPVTIYVDSAARLAIKQADIMLIGADAITSTGKVINKIGSEMFAQVAESFGVPVYVCTDSWKFDPKSIFGYEETIEKRSKNEVWNNPPKGVDVSNYAFEKVDSDLIEGIISELGLYSTELFIEEIRRNYPFIFEN